MRKTLILLLALLPIAAVAGAKFPGGGENECVVVRKWKLL